MDYATRDLEGSCQIGMPKVTVKCVHQRRLQACESPEVSSTLFNFPETTDVDLNDGSLKRVDKMMSQLPQVTVFTHVK